ncbi:MAG: glycosyltransferase family 4 protein [Rhodobacteraceae bacterium]|nr:glycosyltransferase family 4 protein [Paracoccaceae bacterium]
MPQIYYDLTELFTYYGGRARYYGIAKVVSEVAREISLRHPQVRFVVFSSGHRDFFEVTLEDLATLSRAASVRMRHVFPEPRLLRDLLAPPVWGAGRLISRRRWSRAGLDFPVARMEGGALVSAARVKLFPEMIEAIHRSGADVALHPILHDFMPLTTTPDWRQDSWRRKFHVDNRVILEAAPQVVTVSQYTADEAWRLADEGVLPRPTEVRAVQLLHECPAGEDTPDQRPPQEPYPLAVGQRVGRKNLECTFDALLALQEAGQRPPALVLAGGRRADTIDCLAQPKYDAIRDRVLHYVDVSQTDLVALYRNALATVMATRMEGWGLPAGESLWEGTPALCSDIPVLHEVCGDLALYFDPDSPQQLADHVQRLMRDDSFREALRRRIATARPGLRGWSAVADDLVAVVEAFHGTRAA